MYYTCILILPVQALFFYWLEPAITRCRSQKITQTRFEEQVNDDSNKGNVPYEVDNRVRNCITGNVISVVTPDIATQPFTLLDKLQYQGDAVREDVFKTIYQQKTWVLNDLEKKYRDDNPDDNFHVSGEGSFLYWAQEAMATLHTIVDRLKKEMDKSKIKILDIPCGDMAWISRFLKMRKDVDYTGMDIVQDLINHHQETYNYVPWRFVHHDIVHTPLNEAYDLIFSRMMTQHLHTGDILKTLKRFQDSNSSYLLTTTFPLASVNRDIQPSENMAPFREVNFEIPPLSLTPPLCLQQDGPPGNIVAERHYLGLWSLPLKVVVNCTQLKRYTLPGHLPQKAFACTERLDL